MQLATVVLFRLDENMVKELYTTVGPDFVNTLLQPEANSAVRCYTSDSEAKDLYTSGRRDIQDELKANLSEKLQPRGIIIEDVLLKDLQLPDMLSRTIEMKLETEQEAKQNKTTLSSSSAHGGSTHGAPVMPVRLPSLDADIVAAQEELAERQAAAAPKKKGKRPDAKAAQEGRTRAAAALGRLCA